MFRTRPLRTLIVLLLCSVYVLCHYWRALLPSDAQNIISSAENKIEDTIRSRIAGLRGSNAEVLLVDQARRKVALEAHIMSKCGDARICLNELILPTMSKVSDRVDFKLSFIGTTSQRSDDVECKHGPQECLGDMLILCAEQSYPVKQSLGFAHCMVNRFQDIPQKNLVSNCALEHGMDMGKLNSCASDSNNGMQLLRRSVQRSQRAGAARSCTIRLNEKKWCIVDGGQWKECEGHGHRPQDLMDAIRKLSDGK